MEQVQFSDDSQSDDKPQHNEEVDIKRKTQRFDHPGESFAAFGNQS